MDASTSPRIVVGVDGSEQSIAALRFARKLAPPFGAVIQAVSTWDYPPEYAGYVPLGSDNFEAITQKHLDSAVEAAFGGNPPEGLEKLVIFSHPSKGLVKTAEGAVMLVLGRRGHGTFRGLLMGSVSGACVAHAKCPVLVVEGSTGEMPEDGA
ncbi:universal stress protein [Arthrobacter sp. 260]|uniref:universal stress protein n=1 Tax=Arthrobacter sp. 260 TaxID=2735314 RepID=UPI001491DA2D|nr:universal stress protein [Arthrobacter sp. 260]NOJ58868.1 universal stress protein [Arthrobacter sp. 260]